MIKNPRTGKQREQLSLPIQPRPERQGLMNPNFEYKPAVSTDVRKTWMKFGWKPVHEHDIEGEEK